MNKAKLLIVAFVTCTLVLTSFVIVAASTTASAAELDFKRKFGARTQGAAYIQLKPVLAPVRSGKGKQTKNAIVTVIMKIRDNTRVGAVCHYGPKLKDALLSAWYLKPIAQSYLFDRDKHKGKTRLNYKRTRSQSREDKRLISILNRAIGGKDVTRIMVVKGAYKKPSSVISRLPFGRSSGCDEMSVK